METDTSCAFTRHINAATLELKRRFSLQPEDIAELAIIGGPAATALLSEPIEQKRRPKTSTDGKFSIPFTTAIMMVKGNVSLRDYTEEGLHDAAVLAMADKITHLPAVPISGTSPCPVVPEVQIRTRDGRVVKYAAKSVPGDPSNPVDMETLEAKFRDCASFSAIHISPSNLDRVIRLIRDLENVGDAREIIQLVS